MHEADLENHDFKRKNYFEVDVASPIPVTFHSSNYINIFGNLCHNFVSETMFSLELLYLALDGSPLTQLGLLSIAKKTEYALHIITQFEMTFTNFPHSLLEYLSLRV